MDLIYTLAVTAFTLGVLIAIHEFGHFWVARRCGVKVIRFSIGFGTPLLRWKDKLGTEYVIAAFPLGGYVKMVDEREGEVTPGLEDQAFNRKPVLQRMAVVAAGPVANLLLAVLAYWFVFLSGESGVAPVVGSVEEGSVADVAGLEGGQEMFAITGAETKTWVIWDIINVAWLFDETYVSTFATTAPLLDDDLHWRHPEGRHPMLEAYDLNRDAIFEDFYRTLERAP